MSFRFRRSRTGKRIASVSIGPQGIKRTIGSQGRPTRFGSSETESPHPTMHSRIKGRSAGGYAGSIIAAIVFFAAMALLFG
jgi:hypothetical protein